MTKTKQTKKLALSINTLRRLDDAQLTAVPGGNVISNRPTCLYNSSNVNTCLC